MLQDSYGDNGQGEMEDDLYGDLMIDENPPDDTEKGPGISVDYNHMSPSNLAARDSRQTPSSPGRAPIGMQQRSPRMPLADREQTAGRNPVYMPNVAMRAQQLRQPPGSPVNPRRNQQAASAPSSQGPRQQDSGFPTPGPATGDLDGQSGNLPVRTGGKRQRIRICKKCGQQHQSVAERKRCQESINPTDPYTDVYGVHNPDPHPRQQDTYGRSEPGLQQSPQDNSASLYQSIQSGNMSSGTISSAFKIPKVPQQKQKPQSQQFQGAWNQSQFQSGRNQMSNQGQGQSPMIDLTQEGDDKRTAGGQGNQKIPINLQWSKGNKGQGNERNPDKASYQPGAAQSDGARGGWGGAGRGQGRAGHRGREPAYRSEEGDHYQQILEEYKRSREQMEQKKQEFLQSQGMQGGDRSYAPAERPRRPRPRSRSPRRRSRSPRRRSRSPKRRSRSPRRRSRSPRHRSRSPRDKRKSSSSLPSKEAAASKNTKRSDEDELLFKVKPPPPDSEIKSAAGGTHFCKVCSLSTTSMRNFAAHILGKKHTQMVASLTKTLGSEAFQKMYGSPDEPVVVQKPPANSKDEKKVTLADNFNELVQANIGDAPLQPKSGQPAALGQPGFPPNIKSAFPAPLVPGLQHNTPPGLQPNLLHNMQPGFQPNMQGIPGMMGMQQPPVSLAGPSMNAENILMQLSQQNKNPSEQVFTLTGDKLQEMVKLIVETTKDERREQLSNLGALAQHGYNQGLVAEYGNMAQQAGMAGQQAGLPSLGGLAGMGGPAQPLDQEEDDSDLDEEDMVDDESHSEEKPDESDVEQKRQAAMQRILEAIGVTNEEMLTKLVAAAVQSNTGNKEGSQVSKESGSDRSRPRSPGRGRHDANKDSSHRKEKERSRAPPSDEYKKLPPADSKKSMYSDRTGKSTHDRGSYSQQGKTQAGDRGHSPRSSSKTSKRRFPSQEQRSPSPRGRRPSSPRNHKALSPKEPRGLSPRDRWATPPRDRRAQSPREQRGHSPSRSRRSRFSPDRRYHGLSTAEDSGKDFQQDFHRHDRERETGHGGLAPPPGPDTMGIPPLMGGVQHPGLRPLMQPDEPSVGMLDPGFGRSLQNDSISVDDLEIAQEISRSTGISDMGLLVQAVKMVKELDPEVIMSVAEMQPLFADLNAGLITMEEAAAKIPPQVAAMLMDGTLAPDLLQSLFSIVSPEMLAQRPDYDRVAPGRDFGGDREHPLHGQGRVSRWN